MALTPGTKLGAYEVVSSLGAGGMGEVYRARDAALGRDVAIKVLPPAFSRDEERMRRFVQEAQAAAALDHPNILAIYQIGTHQNSPFIVSELLKGETLRNVLRDGPLPVRKAAEYGIQIARGLAAAHEKGIVHRDLKPDNIFVTEDGRVKILDFGVAKLMAPDAEGADRTMTVQTGAGTILGTVGYMAPEQLRGQSVDARADIFSLGAVLYEMLAGRRAFHKDSTADTMSSVLHDDPPDLIATGRPIPPIIERVVRRCLEKQPQERFQSARDVAFALDDLSSSTTQQGIPAEAPRRRSAARLFAIAAAVVFIAGTAGFAIRNWTRSPTVQPTFTPLTFRRGAVLSARFAPDGDTIVYGAAWDGRPPETFAVTSASSESRPLGLPGTDIYGISSKGELALSLRTDGPFPPVGGMLEQAPLLGGAAPRQIHDKVEYADWGPDGSLAVTLDTGLGDQLEYPIGTPLYAKDWPIHMIRIAPDGSSVAFMEPTSQGASVAIIDREKRKTTVSDGWLTVAGLAWAPDGHQIWFSARSRNEGWALYAVTRSGALRTVLRTPGSFYLHDVARDGRVLVSEERTNEGIRYLGAGGDREEDLSWLDRSALRDVSKDGKTILFNELGDGAAAEGAIYVRRTDGSPAVRLGSGVGYALSPDGDWVLAAERGGRNLKLIPTGPGSAVALPGNIRIRAGRFLPDGRRVIFTGFDADGKLRIYVQASGGEPRPIAPQSDYDAVTVSPDGSTAATTVGRKVNLLSVNGGALRPLPWAAYEEFPIGWSTDGRSLFMTRGTGVSAEIDRVDVASGAHTPWKQLLPSDAAGVTAVENAVLLENGATYAYSYERRISQLFVLTGLK